LNLLYDNKFKKTVHINFIWKQNRLLQMENKNAILAAYPTYFHSYPLKFKSVLGISLLITNYFIWRYS
jgi:hypothetical protein